MTNWLKLPGQAIYVPLAPEELPALRGNELVLPWDVALPPPAALPAVMSFAVTVRVVLFVEVVDAAGAGFDLTTGAAGLGMGGGM